MTDEEICLERSSLVKCACGKRSSGDCQKVVRLEKRVGHPPESYFCPSQDYVSEDMLVADMECQVCGEIHRLVTVARTTGGPT